MTMVEAIGYLGSVLVALSLSMSNIRRLRWINLFGASIFGVYGVLIGAWPVALLNGFISLMDVFHLYRMSRRSEYFSLLKLQTSPSPFLNRFLDHYRADMAAFMPAFDAACVTHWEGVWVLRNMMPAGLFVYERTATGELRVLLDYVVPAHRDLKNGRWMFRQGLDELFPEGPTRVVTEGGSPEHRRYLKRIGFKPCGEDRYCLETAGRKDPA